MAKDLVYYVNPARAAFVQTVKRRRTVSQWLHFGGFVMWIISFVVAVPLGSPDLGVAALAVAAVTWLIGIVLYVRSTFWLDRHRDAYAKARYLDWHFTVPAGLSDERLWDAAVLSRELQATPAADEAAALKTRVDALLRQEPNS